MNRALLLSAVLLTTAGCAANEEGLDAARSEAELTRTDMIETQFVSTTTHTSRQYVREEQPDGSWAWVEKQFQVKARLKIVKAATYSLDDAFDHGLDYEAILEEFVESTGQTFYPDSTTYFIRRDATGYTFFNCSSTRRCYSDSDTARMELTADGDTLVVDAIYGLPEGPREFVAVRR